MIEITRIIENQILENLKPQRAVVILGARRTGKTFLLDKIIPQLTEPYLLLNGEDITTQEKLELRASAHYRELLGNCKILIIDEAQKIPEIGSKIKLMLDTIMDLKAIITGSSALDIEQETGEPLTGRKRTFLLFPFSESELDQRENPFEKEVNLKFRLVYGNYPEVTNTKGLKEKEVYLKEILNSYLLKDILTLDKLRNSRKLFQLLQLIAYQVGSEVSLQELGKKLSMSKNTVERYLDLLAKVFVVFRVRGYSRNLRKEVVKTSKWYFYDNGIRNAVIADLKPLESRNDARLLWENYAISERLKFQNYADVLVNNYFWRTYDQQEIDWVEEHGGKLYGYEMKWNPDTRVKVPGGWENTYPEATFKVITPKNYLLWLNDRNDF